MAEIRTSWYEGTADRGMSGCTRTGGGVLSGSLARSQILVVAAVAGLTGLLSGCGSPEEGGPLRGAPEHGYTLTVAPGETFTDGMEILVVHGDKPAVIDSVELVGAKGMKVLGFKFVGPGRAETGQWWPGYPPEGRGLEQGLVVPASTKIQPQMTNGWELLLGIKVTKPGPLWRDGIRYTYTVDGVQYATTVPAQLKVCTSPEQEIDGGCPPPD